VTFLQVLAHRSKVVGLLKTHGGSMLALLLTLGCGGEEESAKEETAEETTESAETEEEAESEEGEEEQEESSEESE